MDHLNRVCVSAPVDHLTAQGDDILKFDFTKIRHVVLWGCVKREFLPLKEGDGGRQNTGQK
jgi:hypothetical protein